MEDYKIFRLLLIFWILVALVLGGLGIAEKSLDQNLKQRDPAVYIMRELIFNKENNQYIALDKNGKTLVILKLDQGVYQK